MQEYPFDLLTPLGYEYIYALCDPRTTDVHYVGRTKDMKYRFASHMRDGNGITFTLKEKWIARLRALKLHPSVMILAVAESCEAPRVEKEWIAKCRDAGCLLVNDITGSGSSAAKLRRDQKSPQ